ncbi:MAG: LysR family transcriptional regulator [Acidimicrobiia bacterium]
MDLRQLNTLLAIADHGSFSAAARALFTVQSNVSGHIARLEKELGATLVDRQRGELTEEGAIVVERARRIQRELDAISSDMASRGTDVAGDARVGVIGTTGRWLMPLVLTALGKSHPRVRALVAEGSTSSLLPRLVSGQLDAAVIHLPVDDPELTVEPLFAEDLVVLVHTSHPMSDHDVLPLRAVAAYPLLLPPPGTALRRIIDRASQTAGITLRAQAEIDGVRLMSSLAIDGYGPTIVPATAVPRWASGEFRRIQVPELPRRVIECAYRRRPALAPPVRAVLEVIHSTIASRGDRQPGVHVENVSPLAGR